MQQAVLGRCLGRVRRVRDIGEDGHHVGCRVGVETRHERVGVGIGSHSGRIEGEFPAPHQARVLTVVDDLLKDALDALDAHTLPTTTQAGMIRQLLVEGIATVPTVREVE